MELERHLPLNSMRKVKNPQKTRALLSNILRKIRQDTNLGSNFEDVLNAVFDSLRHIIPFDRLAIALLEEQGTVLRAAWLKSSIPVSALKKNYAARVEGSSLQRVLREGHPRIISDLRQYLASHPQSLSTQLILKDGILSSLTLPLMTAEGPLGVIFFSSATPNTYDDSHLDLLTEIAEQVTAIVEHGKLRRFFEEKMSKDRLLATVIHDLKSPLAVIKGYLDLISSRSQTESLPEETKSFVSILKRNSDAMLDLISDLSVLNQLSADGNSLKIRPLPLRPFLSAFVEDAEIFANAKDIRFIAALDRFLPGVARMDEQKILRVLQNLLSNAVKFSHPRTAIFFDVRNDGERLTFTMTDQGQGIPAEEIPQLFRWFGRTSTAPTANESSTGLGLSIAKGIVQAHGGEIAVKSRLHVGSSFSFWIPLPKDS